MKLVAPFKTFIFIDITTMPDIVYKFLRQNATSNIEIYVVAPELDPELIKFIASKEAQDPRVTTEELETTKNKTVGLYLAMAIGYAAAQVDDTDQQTAIVLVTNASFGDTIANILCDNIQTMVYSCNTYLQLMNTLQEFCLKRTQV